MTLSKVDDTYLTLVHTNLKRSSASSRILFRNLNNPTNGLQHGDLQQGRCALTHHVFQGYLETASMDGFNGCSVSGGDSFNGCSNHIRLVAHD